MLQILDYVQFNPDETANTAEFVNQRADDELHRRVGAMLLSGQATSVEEAMVMAEPEVSKLRTVYEVYDADPAVLYPVVIAYLRDDPEWRLLAAEPDAALTRLILDRSPNAELAQFVLQGRQTILEALNVPPEAWDLALESRDAIPDRQRSNHQLRDKALEAARRFATEALHQTVGKPIRFRLTPKRDEWRLFDKAVR